MRATSAFPTRIVRLDTARLSAVMAVIVLHAAAAYTVLIPWWYVTPRQTAPIFDLLIVMQDGWVMPALFGIAGFFSLPSLERRGSIGFLGGRLKRLGLPLVGLTIFFCPVIGYLDRLNKGLTGTFWDYWLGLLPSLTDWRLRALTGQENLGTGHGLMGPYHLWFLALLLLMSFALVLGAGLVRPKGRVAKPGRHWLAWGVVCGMGLAEAWAQMRIPDAAWVRWGPFCVVQLTRLPLYVGFFLLGLLAWREEWFAVRWIPGPLWAWGLASLVTFVAMIAGGSAMGGPGGKPLWIPFGYGLARTAFGLAATGLVLCVCGHREHRAGRLTASLTRSSFDLYLLHMPLVVLVQYLLAATLVPLSVKFTLALVLPTGVAWGASRLLVGRHKTWRPLAVAAAFGLCILVWGA